MGLLAGVVVSVAFAGSPPTARAGSLNWSAPIALDPLNGAPQALAAVACPSATRCTAVEAGSGQQVTFDPTASTAPTSATIVNKTNGLLAVACPSPTQCTAIDQAVDGSGRAVTFDPTPGGPLGPSTITLEPAGQGQPFLTSVACPSTTQCTAVDSAGVEWTFNPKAPTTAPTKATIDLGNTLTGVACPPSSQSQCTAVDSAGVEVTFDPTMPAKAPTSKTIDGNSPTAVACPSATRCVAVDSSGGEATFDPTNTAASFTAPTGGSNLTAVACPAVALCIAVDQSSGQQVTFEPSAGQQLNLIVIDATASLNGVACPSSIQCTAVDSSGREVTFTPRSTDTPPVTLIDASGTLNGVACPAANQCTAVDGPTFQSPQQVTFDPTTPGTPPTRSAIDSPGLALTDVACPSTTQCTAVDNVSKQVTFNPGTGAVTTALTTIDKPNVQPLRLACPSVGQCTAVDSAGGATTFDPHSTVASASTQVDVPLPAGATLNGVACPSTGQCTAVDSVGVEVTFTPNAPATRTRATIDPGHNLTGVACPTPTRCTAVDKSGSEVTFDPTAPSAAPTPVVIDAGNSLSRVACPLLNECVAVDDAGRAVQGDPATPGGFVVVPIAGAGSLSAVACFSAAQCVAVDTAGHGFLGTARSSSTSVSCVPATVVAGNASTCTATVSDTGSGATQTPSGTVAFSRTGTGTLAGTPCTLAPTGTSGQASCHVSYTPAAVDSGTQTITASYPGDDPLHAASIASTPVSVLGSARSSSTSVSCVPGSVVVGSASTCTATVSDSDTGATQAPSGTLVLSHTGTGSFGGAPCTLAPTGTSGQASCHVSYNPAALDSGTHTITASYPGDAVHAASTANTPVTVVGRSSSTSVSCVPATVVAGSASTCTATVSDSGSGATQAPSGTIALSHSGTGSFGGTPCTLAPTGTSGQASCHVPYTPTAVDSGTHTITASYPGDPVHAPSTGNASLSVSAPAGGGGGSGGGGGGPGGGLPGGGVPGGAVTPVVGAPVVSGFGLTNNPFVVGAVPTPTSGSAARAAKHKQGTTFHYTLSEAATVRITIAQRAPGRRQGRRCLAAKGKHPHAKKCTRIVTKATLTRTSHAGLNRVAFSGRIGARVLRPGRYQAMLVAIDAAHKTSTRQAIAFAIVAR